MEGWATAELGKAQLGDSRRTQRLIKIVEDLAGQPGASVPLASMSVAATKATYEFWSSPYIQPEEIQKSHAMSTIERIKEHTTVLAIQDTTNLDFTNLKATTGLGYLDHPKLMGLKVHSTFMATTSGVPLGIINQQVYSRNIENLGIAKQCRQRATEEKESQRWISGLLDTQRLIPDGVELVTVTDREGDFYDLFIAPRSLNSHLLIRGAYNRCIDDEAKYLLDAISLVEPCGTMTVELQHSQEQQERRATLLLRKATFAILPPKNHQQRSQIEPVSLQVIWAIEEHQPQGVKPIDWLLLTTLPVNNLDDVARCIRWYTYRWLIERYHYTLKSGCGIEKLQLENARRIKMALATYSIVAWRLLWLTYESRVNPDQPCDTVLELHEWQSLCATISGNASPPLEPPSLHDAVRMIAKLGGFLGRKTDGQPGVKTIWRGLTRLHDIAATWKLLHSPSKILP